MDPGLARLLTATNPWLSDPPALQRLVRARRPPKWFAREARPALVRAIADRRKAHLVIGPRQAGKSSLIWEVLAERGRPVLYVNCEEPAVRSWMQSPAMVAAELPEWLPENGTLFLEEAQWIEEAGLLLKGLVDAATGRTIVATGSASFHLAARTRESLAGRATRHRVFPFSLQEAAIVASNTPSAVWTHLLERAMQRMLLIGGYPEAWTAEDPQRVLAELLEAFVLRDASDRFRIGRPDALRRLMRVCAGQIGDLVNLSEWSRVLGISTSTVGDYVALMEEAHVLVQVRPFAGGKRSELTQAPKVYWLDNGLRNVTSGGFLPWEERVDRGALMENWVFSELHKLMPNPGDIRFWRTRGGAEVDFVLEPTLGRLVGIEVKAGARRPGTALGRSLHSFIDAYHPEQVWILHQGEAAEQEVSGTRVRWVPAVHLPDRARELLDG